MALLKVDGVEYDVLIDSLTENGEILSSDDSGRTQSGDMFIDVIGTFYNYEIHLKRRITTSQALYDSLFDVLTAPVAFHDIEVPHGQGTIAFTAYISSTSRNLLQVKNGVYFWGDMTLKFVAKSPYRRA